MSSPADAPSVLSFGPFVLDKVAGRLLQDGQAVELAPRTWAVLVHLAERPEQLVSKDELLDAVWGHRHVSDSVLKVAINSLRTRLGDSATEPRCIQTVARRGYRFVAPQHDGADRQGGRAAKALQPFGTPAPAPGQPSAAVPAASAVVAGNLPAWQVALVGRDLERADLRQRLATRRLVTVLGPGGVGKTQLALAAAGQDAPPDGVWLVRLDALADASTLLDTVSRALSLGANAGRSAETMAQALEPLALRLVLDNSEHLIDALAPLVAHCLQQAPRLQVLVTSQTPLRIAGESLMPLHPLPVPPVGEGTLPLDYPAAALFVERVRSHLPLFQPGAREAADIGALCRLLDGLPLALELAAARVPLLGTAGVLARMTDRFALLSRGARDAPQRHRTLRDALEWSFGLLKASELQVLRRLSVFAGSFTPALAKAVTAEPGAGEWQVLDALQDLQDHSLLAIEAASGGSRLRLLESVRTLAGEGLRAAGDDGATLTRLAQAMRDLFKDAQAHYTRTPLLPWLQPLRPEADNLRVAMSHALQRMQALEGTEGAAEALNLAVELFSSAVLFWLRSGRKREAQRAYEGVAPQVWRLEGAPQRAAFGLAVGALAAYGQSLPPAEAVPGLQEAETLFAGLGDGRSAMLAVYLRAALMQRMAPAEDRTPLLRRMRSFEQPDWSPRERNFADWTEAVNAHGHGDLAAFHDFCAADLERARAGDDRAEAWVAAFGLGQAQWALGRHERARDTLADAVADLRACGLLREYATTAGLAASVRLAVDGSSAEGLVREAADVMRAEGMLWWMGEALMMLPAHRGQWPAALRLRAWIDERMRGLGVKRSPVAASLAEAFETLLASARAQPGWVEPEAAASPALDDAEVLRLSFGQEGGPRRERL